jgi:hypothetical protein
MRRSMVQGRAWWARAGSESGQTMAEYATVLGVLIIAVVAAIGLFTTGVENRLQSDIVTILSGT